MRIHKGLKPQDIVVLMKLHLWREKGWKHTQLAEALGLSQSEISFSLERCRLSELIDTSKKRVMRKSLLEFLLHGVRYVFPTQPGAVVNGVPTAHSASPLKRRILSAPDDQYVWPWRDGDIRGQSIQPLYENAPIAALKDSALHELLALVDALRAGRARERTIAQDEIGKRLRITQHD